MKTKNMRGKIRNPRRAAASRRNGLLGGRPITDRHQHRARHVGPRPSVAAGATSVNRTDHCGCGARRKARIHPDGHVSYGLWIEA
jgi:hypothetical protein